MMKHASLPLRAPGKLVRSIGGRPAKERVSARLVVSVAWPLATVVAKRTKGGADLNRRAQLTFFSCSARARMSADDAGSLEHAEQAHLTPARLT